MFGKIEKVEESTLNLKTGQITTKELKGKELEEWLKENEPGYLSQYHIQNNE